LLPGSLMLLSPFPQDLSIFFYTFSVLLSSSFFFRPRPLTKLDHWTHHPKEYIDLSCRCIGGQLTLRVVCSLSCFRGRTFSRMRPTFSRRWMMGWSGFPNIWMRERVTFRPDLGFKDERLPLGFGLVVGAHQGYKIGLCLRKRSNGREWFQGGFRTIIKWRTMSWEIFSIYMVMLQRIWRPI
jgi:hypothetical protein